jgi:hypothetical protein
MSVRPSVRPFEYKIPNQLKELIFNISIGMKVKPPLWLPVPCAEYILLWNCQQRVDAQYLSSFSQGKFGIVKIYARSISARISVSGCIFISRLVLNRTALGSWQLHTTFSPKSWRKPVDYICLDDDDSVLTRTLMNFSISIKSGIASLSE